MGLKNLENFLGNHIEGFFNRRFASALEPAELVRALEQGLLRSKKKVGDEMLLPNDCSLLLGEEDYQRLCAARMLDELYEAADRLVIRENCFLDGKLRIRMEKKEGLTGVEVVCSDTTQETSEQEEPHTLVLERRKFDTFRIAQRQKGSIGSPYNMFNLYPFDMDVDLIDPGPDASRLL